MKRPPHLNRQFFIGALFAFILSGLTLTAYMSLQSDSTPTLPAATDASTGGAAKEHVVANVIKLVTGQYIPVNIDIHAGETVTWEITDSGAIPNYGIVSNSGSQEDFSSATLRTGDSFSHTFNTPGTYGWHDMYNGNLRGTVTVLPNSKR